MTLGYLGPRERAVARYLLGGWTYESIGYQLDISPLVAKQYGHRVIQATGKPNVVSAVLSIMRDPVALSVIMEVPVG